MFQTTSKHPLHCRTSAARCIATVKSHRRPTPAKKMAGGGILEVLVLNRHKEKPKGGETGRRLKTVAGLPVPPLPRHGRANLNSASPSPGLGPVSVALFSLGLTLEELTATRVVCLPVALSVARRVN